MIPRTRIVSRWIVVAALFVTALPLVGCRHDGNATNEERTDRATIRGSVLDRATGTPIGEARVEFPDGRHAATDAAGRFELGDFELGTSGEVRATMTDGRRASVRVRPLGPGALEVVLHAGP